MSLAWQDAQNFDQDPPTGGDEVAQEERRRLLTNLRSFDLRRPQLLEPPQVVTY
jgi:hypothetical protein